MSGSPVAVPCVRLAICGCVAHRPLPLAQVASSATGSAPFAPPIIQNGKLVGAVTHVLVNDPTTGYGIFIENMLAAAA